MSVHNKETNLYLSIRSFSLFHSFNYIYVYLWGVRLPTQTIFLMEKTNNRMIH